jgi:hypothetical protein
MDEMASIWIKNFEKKRKKLKNLNFISNKKSITWQVWIDVKLVPSHTLGLRFLKKRSFNWTPFPLHPKLVLKRSKALKPPKLSTLG